MANRNLELLIKASRVLRPILDELVFVGGCTTALLITDPGAAEVRSTYDVDAIVEINSYAEYAAFSEKLRSLGFGEDQSEGAPICRWIHGEVRLDVMPTDQKILGFSNRWYKPALESAQKVALEEGLAIRVITAPLFLGTKFEAFHGRGKSNYFESHDLEDIIAVADGRPGLPDEVRKESVQLRSYIATEIKRLIEKEVFLDLLPGFLLPDTVSQARLGGLLKTLSALAGS